MTRIAMLIPTIDQIGGAERQVILLAKQLSSRGWQVTLIALSGNGANSTHVLEASGVHFLSLGMRKAWIDSRGWRRYLNWASRNKPEIVHAHLPHASWFARCVRLFSPARVQLDTIHTSNPGSIARRLLYRLTNQLTDCVTCVSNSVAQTAIESGLTTMEKSTVLYNGVDAWRQNPSTVGAVCNSSNPSSTRPFRWIAVGRLSPVKDYPTLLRAFANLPNHPCLLIVGSGPDHHALRNLVCQLQIEQRVHFTGFEANVQPLLSTADAFVLSSLWEGLPMGVLEAGSAGLPVVATDGKGTREAMVHGETGLIVPVGDHIALATAMGQVMSMTPSERQKWGIRGRQFVEEHFSLPVIVDQWERLYSRLLHQHTHPSRHA